MDLLIKTNQMKNNIILLVMALALSVIFLSSCNGSRYAQGDRGDRRTYHNHGINNRGYRGY